MTLEQLLEKLKTKFGTLNAEIREGVLEIGIESKELRAIMLFLRDECGFDYLQFMTAIDRISLHQLEIIYRLFSYTAKTTAVVRCSVDRAAPAIATISDVFRTAEWHEREAAEMFGITFTDHPDPRRLLTTDDLEGWPLRKDFTHENLIPLPEV